MSNSFVSLSPPKQFVWGVTAKVIRRFRQQPEGGCIGKRKLHSSTTCRVLTRLACGRIMYENRFPSLHHQSGWGINRCSLWLCLRPNQTSHLHSCISYTIKSVLWGQGELARSIPLQGASAPNVRVRDGSRLRPVPFRYWFTTARPLFGGTPVNTRCGM